MSYILVIGEYQDNHIHGITEELIGGAVRLKTSPKDCVAVAMIGAPTNKDFGHLFCYGTERVFILHSPWVDTYSNEDYAELLGQFISEIHPKIVLLPGTDRGRDFGAKTAAKLGVGLLTDVSEITRDAKGIVTAVRPAYDGVHLSKWQLPEAAKVPYIMSVRQGILEKEPYREGCAQSVVYWEMKHPGKKQSLIEVLQKIEKNGRTVNLSEARIIVAGGRGLKEAGGMEVIQHLAKLLGGQVGCTRPCVDAGWADGASQIGQTGISVKPELYMAFGISGAVQHMAGLKGAKYIVAVNTDPQAPIFRNCDFGILGDARQTAEELISALEALKQS